MKKKSLGQVYWDVKTKVIKKIGLGYGIEKWHELTPSTRKEIESGCKAVAREVRKRDKGKDLKDWEKCNIEGWK
jgi:hypothetical protein